MQKKHFKLGIHLIITIILTLGLSISFQSLLASWQAPGSAPPNGNAQLPIYSASSLDQTIDEIAGTGGGLTVLGNISTPNLAVQGWISNDGDNEGVYVDEDGNVGVGTSSISPTGRILHVKNDSGYTSIIADASTGNASYLSLYSNGTKIWSVGQNPIWDTSSNDFYIYKDGTYTGGPDTQIGGLVIKKNTGDIGIGIINPVYKLDVDGDVKATSFIYSSDRNLKENIKPINNALDKILDLKGVSFDWKKDKKESIGLIAQEVEKIFPEIVHTNENNGLKSVEYGNLVAPLIEAIKKQQKEIEELKLEIEKLK